MLDFDVYFTSVYQTQVQKMQKQAALSLTEKPAETEDDDHIISILDYTSGQRYTFLANKEPNESEAQNPKPKTQNPKPKTLNPKP